MESLPQAGALTTWGIPELATTVTLGLEGAADPSPWPSVAARWTQSGRVGAGQALSRGAPDSLQNGDAFRKYGCAQAGA